jgi:hypothetical protein
VPLEGALSGAALVSPGRDRIEIGPGYFTAAAGGYQYSRSSRPRRPAPSSWCGGLILSGTAENVDLSGAHGFIAVQLNPGAKVEHSTVHGDPTQNAISVTGDSSVSDSSIETTGRSISTFNGAAADVSRTRIDAHSGRVVLGTSTLTISDSLILTHGGPGCGRAQAPS